MKALCDGRYVLIFRISIGGAFISRWEKIRPNPGLFNRSVESLHFLKSAGSIIDTSASPDHLIP
jgi:hypothetical protein